jgi:hypothetical protein
MSQGFKLLENFDNYQFEYLQKLKANIRNFEQIAMVISLFLNKILKKGAFYMNVHVEDLPSILNDEELKSNMLTGKSATIGGQSSRITSTCAMYNVRAEDLQPEDYPKFGYLSCSDSRVNYFTNLDYEYQYGGVALKFKKENLWHRTMLVIGDSMNFAHFNGLVPTRVSRPIATCIYGLSNGHGEPLIRLSSPAPNWYFFADKILKNEINENNFHTMFDTIGGEVPIFDLFELHFIGSLRLNLDVESIDTLKSSFNEQEELFKRTAEYCKDKNIQLNIYDM